MSTLRQFVAVSLMGLGSLKDRFTTALVIVVGMASVVGVLTSMLSVTAGMARSYVMPGDNARALVWAGTANFDQSQSLHREFIGTILNAPGIAKGADGRPLADAEFGMWLPHPDGFADGSLQLRGFGPAGLAIRPEFTIVSGHIFHTGKRELVAGVGAVKRFGLTVGSTVHLQDGDWPIVGIFRCRGEILESYIVGDADTLMAATRRHGYSQVAAQLTNAAAYQPFEAWLTADPALRLSVERKSDYDLRQLGTQIGFFTRMAYLIGAIMAIGALFGVTKIMYSVVRARTREIGTLRAIGFGASPVAASIMVEAALLGMTGALLGTLLAWMALDGHAIWVGGAFRLRVAPQLLGLGMLWALASTIIGGLFPALRAANLQAYEALRSA